MENHCAFCPGAEMPEPFLPQGTCYCCVQKNLTDSRASSLLGLGALRHWSGTGFLLRHKLPAFAENKI